MYRRNIFTKEQIQTICNIPEVSSAHTKLSCQQSVSFTIPLSQPLREALFTAFQLNLPNVETFPCRWIKGDTPAHIDRGQRSFESTYLVYLTDGEGEFRIGDESYGIEAGTAFSFSEGVSHEVTGTNGTSRLLLGPMSEFGFAVGGGGLSADGATTTIYIRQDPDTLEFEYRLNDEDWNNFTFAASSVENTNASPSTNILKVIFTTNLILDNTEHYFVCASDGIQFGSTSLDSNGLRRSISIEGVTGYPGFIQNGSSEDSGYSNISIYNLAISQDGSLLAGFGGWIAQWYFGRDATENYIINCSSEGDISNLGGGIVGLYAAYKDTASSTSLYVIGCSSSGSIGIAAGGIVGGRCGNGSGGSCTVEQCWSTGTMNYYAGGIVGQYAGQYSGSVTISKCYSTGAPIEGSLYGGGICGSFAGFESGSVTVEKSYSTGTIMTDGGGIFGSEAGSSDGTTTASNCYSSGTITTDGTGIFGSNKETGIATNCYSADGSWSDATANTNLTGVPSGDEPGNTWASPGLNSPYELVGIGATPYQLQTIADNSLIQIYSQTITAGEATIEAINADASGNAFTILKIVGGDEDSHTTILMSQQTGSISTTVATAPGTYTLTVRSIGSYFITTFVLTISADASSSATTTGCCVSSIDERGLSYAQIIDYKIGNRLIVEHQQNPNLKFDGYSQYTKYKMAQGSRKI
jgi:hypothetical protein